MTNLRAALTVLVVGLLVLGEAASNQASMTGAAADWASKMDAAPVRLLALLVLVAAVGLALVPDREKAP